MLDVEEYYETDSSENEENHLQLLNSVSQLDSTQRVKPAQRKEIASEVSEYNLNKGLSSKKNLVSVDDLIKVLGNKSSHSVISKKVKKVTEQSKPLPKPLEKPVEERLKRSLGFENVKKQLQKWDAIVTRNALKDKITFPLNEDSIKMEKSNEFLSQFQKPTQLEEEIAKVLKQEIIKEKDSDEDEFPLTLEEMMERRKEMAQIRAKLFYKQIKAQRQSKIKSKKYHRLLKREKIRQQLKEFEILQKTDPEAALKKLSELDKTRAQERATLRHRNTGQWAKNLTVRAKYDVETRKVLAEQLKMSRELTQKVSTADSSGDDDDDDDDDDKLVEPTSVKTTHQEVTKTDNCSLSNSNPWILEVSQEVQDFVSGYKKFWTEKGNEINPNEENIKTDKKSNVDLNERRADINGEETQNTKLNNSIHSEFIMKNRNFEKRHNENSVNLNRKKFSSDLELEKTQSTNLNDFTQSEVVPKKKRSKKSKTVSEEAKPSVAIHPASGLWLVTPVKNEYTLRSKNKRKAEDLDTLFDELNDKLINKAKKKIKKISKNLAKQTKKFIDEPNKESEKEFDLSLKNTIAVEKADEDMGLLEGGVENGIRKNNHLNAVEQIKAVPEIDPKNFIQIKPKKLKTHLPENITGDENDDEKIQRKLVEEAFGDDDVVAEFNANKKEEEKNSRVEIDLSLPGWGRWGGSGIKSKPKRKKLLVINLPPRKDKFKKDVIINENENPNVKNHLVKEVPHPFQSVETFEANIRAPVGRDWVPETAHQKLIEKQVETKLGTIIEPMNEGEIVRLGKTSKSPYKGKKKKSNDL